MHITAEDIEYSLTFKLYLMFSLYMRYDNNWTIDYYQLPSQICKVRSKCMSVCGCLDEDLIKCNLASICDLKTGDFVVESRCICFFWRCLSY